MSDVITSSQLLTEEYPISGVFTGSSRKESTELREILDWLCFSIIRQDFYYLRGVMPLFEIDISSVYPHLELTSETYVTEDLTEEEIAYKMLDHDFIIKMPPKKEYTIRVKVRSIEKATPRIIKPDGL